jgi:hypothetical protein
MNVPAKHAEIIKSHTTLTNFITLSPNKDKDRNPFLAPAYSGARSSTRA